jgi:glycerol dehydrogenase
VDEIDRLATVARRAETDVVVGCGGGKAIDVAKGVRSHVGGSLVSFPTVASTDAPTSGLSVVYSDDGDGMRGIVHDKRPDLVLVDTGIVARAPTRWFVSGIGDGLATKFEATATVESGGQTITGDTPTRAGVALAEECYTVLRKHANEAVEAVRDGTVTDAVEATTESIILLSGLGFENGGLAAAHAIHDGIVTTVDTDATHGEIVSFGLLAQLVLEGRTQGETRDIARFTRDIGLPVTLAAVGVQQSHVDDIADTVCTGRGTIANQPGDPTAVDVKEALLGADEIGHSMR